MMNAMDNFPAPYILFNFAARKIIILKYIFIYFDYNINIFLIKL